MSSTMAHNITERDGFFTVREPAWHGLGVVLTDYPTRAEAQAIAHPWDPIEAPVYRKTPMITPSGDLTEGFEQVEGSKMIERSDTGHTLGVVNETLGLITNTEMWDVAEGVGDLGTDIQIETAGSLSGGEKVWILLRLTEPLQVKGDPNGAAIAYLGFQNAHNGSGSFRAQAVNTRIVCDNTSSAADVEAKRNGYEFTFRHTVNVKDRIEDAKGAVAMWRHGIEVWHEAMEHYVTERVTVDQRELFIERFQPMPNTALISDRVRGNVEEARAELRTILTGPTSEGVDLTTYGLIQGTIEWASHVRRTRGASEKARAESRFKRSMLSTDRLTTDIVTLAREAAHA